MKFSSLICAGKTRRFPAFSLLPWLLLSTALPSLVLLSGCGGGNSSNTPAPVVVAIAPALATVDVSKQLSFTADVTGTGYNGVSWSVDEADGGSITDGGFYTAPAVAGTYHVRAKSVADPDKTAVVEVRVRATTGTIGVN